MNNYRQIVSIVLLITSAVLILTGGLILLHLDSRTVMHLHKYFGMAFMGAALLHMGINSKPLRHYLGMRSLVVPLLVEQQAPAPLPGHALAGGPPAGGGRPAGRGRRGLRHDPAPRLREICPRHDVLLPLDRTFAAAIRHPDTPGQPRHAVCLKKRPAGKHPTGRPLFSENRLRA